MNENCIHGTLTKQGSFTDISAHYHSYPCTAVVLFMGSMKPDISEENSSESIRILVFCVITLCHNIVDDLPTCQASRCHNL